MLGYNCYAEIYLNVWDWVGCVGVLLPPPREVAAVLIGW